MPRIAEAERGRGLAEAIPSFGREERSLREQAEDLLSVAECVTREGWGDAVAAQLRQAARDLLELSRPRQVAC